MSDENEILEGMGLDENPSKDSDLDSSGEAQSQAGIDALLDGAADDAPIADDGPADQAAIDAMMDGAGGGDNGDSAEPGQAKSDEPALHVEIEKVITDTNYLLTDVEGLILAKVFYGLHEAYYDSWVKDARDNHSLIMRLNRRLRRYRGEIPKSKAVGGPR